VKLTIDLQNFQRRVLQDCLTEVLPMYWLDRAKAFEAAAPRNGDFHGNASNDELMDAYVRCHATAAACRNHARLLFFSDGLPDYLADEIDTVLAEVA
jgi:hypothetical protein